MNCTFEMKFCTRGTQIRQHTCILNLILAVCHWNSNLLMVPLNSKYFRWAGTYWDRLKRSCWIQAERWANLSEKLNIPPLKYQLRAFKRLLRRFVIQSYICDFNLECSSIPKTLNITGWIAKVRTSGIRTRRVSELMASWSSCTSTDRKGRQNFSTAGLS